jgi:putative ABC transport system ATP-binding protein
MMTVTELTTTAIYELRSAGRRFGQGATQVNAVHDVDLTIDEGEFVALVGPSGSGKTTLLQLLGGLDRATEGGVLFEGRDLATLGDGALGALRLRTFGFVFQQFNLIPTLTAAQNVEVALAPAHARASQRHARVEALLESVGLAGRARHLPSQLSGGEQQRVAIARALANEPRVVLADEPTGNLDTTTGEEIIDLITSLSRERRQTVVLVTHNPEIAGRAGRVLELRDGRLLADVALGDELAAAPTPSGTS